MRRRLALVATAVLSAILLSAIAWPLYGAHAFVASVQILAPLGAIGVLLADALFATRGRVRSVRRQSALLAVLVLAQLAVAIALFADAMFVSSEDAFFMALAAGYAALVGLGSARLLAQRTLSDLEAVRAALAKVGAGAREVSIPVGGSREMASLGRDVQGMVSRLAAEERARQELVASVSHDLRTPVTTIRLIAEGLEDGVFEPERTREQLRLIASNVRALSALIDDLFELSRLEAGDIQWSMQRVELDELVRETVEAIRPQAELGAVSVEAELDAGLRPARANPEQLQRVLFNLIQNAIRHTPADGSVVIRAREAADALEVEVADSGAGIEPELAERLFDPFVQGPSRVAGRTGSAGLGLAIARAIIHAHGGRIWLADGSGGTRICFSLQMQAA